jgi:phytoene dehydrogenase-like protein|eukprot:scaffold1967_cov199-Alexandrium_tamarense.AAC.63
MKPTLFKSMLPHTTVHGVVALATLLLNAFVLVDSFAPSPRCSHRYHISSAASTTLHATTTPHSEYDAIIVGSGIGGLSAAALLSHYGYSVAVFEAHSTPGGAAHGYTVNAKDVGPLTFDTGPSFFSGLNSNYPAKSSNPLRSILDIIDEKVECIPYTTFGLMFPEGVFVHSSNFGKEGSTVEAVSGSNGVQEWASLMKSMDPLAQAVDAMPTLALRADLGLLASTSQFLPNFAKLNPLQNLKLTKPFSNIINEAGVKDTFIRNWLDVLCFCLSGVPSDGTITAEMAMMMGEFYDEDAIMDCPVGGASAIVDALVRGIEKKGGKVFCNSRIDEICIENGKAVGVRLAKNYSRIKATKGVISNLSVWDLMNSGIVDTDLFPEDFVKERKATPACPSFMHLHVGFQITKEELSKLQAHYIFMNDWERGVTAEENCALVSIPSVHDNTLAPDNHAVLHIYTPATELYERWENVKRNTPEYNQLKEERSAFLWKVLEKIIPDIRQRAVHSKVGTPLTHQRFLNRYRGSYGPAIRAGDASFPFPNTPIQGLLLCGDSCFPGIGVPAVAGSGMIAANSVSLDSIGAQLEVLSKIKQQ